MLEQEKKYIYICWKKLEANSTHQHIFLFWFWIRSCVERAVILNISKEVKFVFICAFTFPFVAFFVFILYYSHDRIVRFQIWSEEDSFWQMIVNVIKLCWLEWRSSEIIFEYALMLKRCERNIPGTPALHRPGSVPSCPSSNTHCLSCGAYLIPHAPGSTPNFQLGLYPDKTSVRLWEPS